MSLKRPIQLWLAKWMEEPEILAEKTTGYSLVRLEKSGCSFEEKAYAVAPYLLQHVLLDDYSYFAMNAHAANVSIEEWWNGTEDEIQKVKELEFRVEDFFS